MPVEWFLHTSLKKIAVVHKGNSNIFCFINVGLEKCKIKVLQVKSVIFFGKRKDDYFLLFLIKVFINGIVENRWCSI